MNSEVKNRSLRSICLRVVLQGAALTFVIALALVGVIYFQKSRSVLDLEMTRLQQLIPSIENSLTGEVMIGDDRAIKAVVQSVAEQQHLKSLEFSREKIECSSPANAWGIGVKEVCLVHRVDTLRQPYFFKIVTVIESSPLRSSLLFYFSILLLVGIFGTFITSRLLKQLTLSIVQPIQKLAENPEDWSGDQNHIAKEAVILHSQLQSYMSERDKQKEEAALAELASQVAHDIRSPVAALQVAAFMAKEMDDECRSIIQGATSRIQDIANSLVHFRKTSDKKVIDSIKGKAEAHLLSEIVDPLMTEKKMRYRDRVDLDLRVDWNETARNAFVKVEPIALSRALSNIIDNAVEAIPEKGAVVISASLSSQGVELSIKDTGKGIPSDVLANLTKRRITYDKAGGSGFGLLFAKEFLNSFGATLDIHSRLQQGTEIKIGLPRS